ncbi:MAG: GNAT family N-acetyltransferase [Cyanobacteriota bacterium]|nr:GNAT family N-acetyltransferase [Cyanobacteriota bacterium]
MFRVALNAADRQKAMVVRGIVFVGEQQISYQETFDECDETAVLILGERDGEPFATARIRNFESYAKLERIAVLQAYRLQGYGTKLLDFAIEYCQQQNIRTFKLSGQIRSKAFYKKYGFQDEGDRFVDAGIEHCTFTLKT